MRQDVTTAKWERIAEIYRRFAADFKGADFGDGAKLAMYQHESTGVALPDPKTNGYAIGKKWMDVTIAAWKEDIVTRGLLVSELIADGYPKWFLERVGVLSLAPKSAACSYWLNKSSFPSVAQATQ